VTANKKHERISQRKNVKLCAIQPKHAAKSAWVRSPTTRSVNPLCRKHNRDDATANLKVINIEHTMANRLPKLEGYHAAMSAQGKP
jgi:hypothetical protein